MALKKVKGNFERMFDKNLTDLVRGIRNNKDNEAKYIAQCMEEIKVELRQDNIAVKANAVAKLTYLQMLGYDISWATFNIIEVMSSNKFTYKRIGYSAASQSFYAGSELIMLTTNMIRKDLNAQNQYEAGLALSGLSCFISHDLARDLANDIMTLMSSTKPYLRMKAVLMMYKVFLRYPEALRPAFPKLKEKLEDPDPGVQSAAVNVVCELARKNPKNYLSLAPVFFKLMTTSTNNWMLIKIIKLFGLMTHYEPEIGRKITKSLIDHICSTSAMSLLYECINTVIAVLISISSGMPGLNTSVELCVQKLRILIEDSDQNLKYLGLLAMSRILKSHPKSVQAHKDLVLACLDDKDESIRLRALGLLYGMVSRKNLMEVVKKLMTHMERAEGTLYRDELLSRIIEICSQNNYRYVMDFEWYITVLIELTEMETSAKHGELIAAQLTDVGVRVKRVRDFACVECVALVRAAAEGSPGPATREVLYSAAFVLSEYCEYPEVMSGAISPLLKCAESAGGARARGVCVLAALKLTAKLLRLQPDVKIIRKALEGLQPLLCSDDMEVQERAHNGQAILSLILTKWSPLDSASTPLEDTNTMLVQHEHSNGSIINEAAETNGDSDIDWSDGLIEEFADMFEKDLKPLKPNAQKRVPVPEDLNLSSWLDYGSSDQESSDSQEESPAALFPGVSPPETRPITQLSQEELDTLREVRRQEQANNPHYLKGETRVEDIPVAEIALEVPLQIYTKRSDKYLNMSKENSSKRKKESRRRKSKKHKYYSESESEESCADRAEVVAGGELPAGARDSDSGEPAPHPHRELDLDLDLPLREDELLPMRIHQYPSPESGYLKGKEAKLDVDSKPKEKKVKKSKRNKDVDLLASTESKKSKKKEKKNSRLQSENMIDIGMDTEKTDKHKASKKDKDKEHKKKRSSKKDHGNKKGYEEAIGISTPSKEVI